MSDRALAFVMAFGMLLAARPGHAQDDETGGDSAADTSMDNEAPPEPEDWEKPPADEEKPRPEVARSTKKPQPGGEKRGSVGLLAGWGFKTDRRSFGADPYMLGLGLRGGYTLDLQLYLGGYFVYYIGGSREGMSGAVNVGTRESHANYVMMGVEAGYDLWIGPGLLRPSLGLGVALGITDATMDGQTTTISDFALHPGMSLLFPIDDWFIGGDVRANVITGDGVSGLAIFANGGLRF